MTGWLPEGKGIGKGEGSKEGQVYCDIKKLDFGLLAHNKTHRYQIIISYIWKLYNVVNQFYLNKFNFKNRMSFSASRTGFKF